ncbi:MAG: hypothetical protein A2341_21770 [Deltaproteobacteria bacterium RIFOXYB12_FULL_58_9]|nr:MAG: hypothetical protein A2341_21770 [Deltaproteobacteria bacterium RIFOXYB12_FULL_58_9]
MFDGFRSLPDVDKDETHEWVEALDDIVHTDGRARASYVVREVLSRARELNIGLSELLQTPYINTILPEDEPEFPGDEVMEKRIRRIIRWNAMAMVTRANLRFGGLGGHISTYASSASLYEVGFNHFFRGKDAPGGGILCCRRHQSCHTWQNHDPLLHLLFDVRPAAHRRPSMGPR